MLAFRYAPWMPNWIIWRHSRDSCEMLNFVHLSPWAWFKWKHTLNTGIKKCHSRFVLLFTSRCALKLQRDFNEETQADFCSCKLSVILSWRLQTGELFSRFRHFEITIEAWMELVALFKLFENFWHHELSIAQNVMSNFGILSQTICC